MIKKYFLGQRYAEPTSTTLNKYGPLYETRNTYGKLSYNLEECMRQRCPDEKIFELIEPSIKTEWSEI